MNGIILASTNSALDENMTSLITSAFDSLKATGIEIFGYAFVAAVGVTVVVAGGSFAIKWIKGILRQAS